MNRPSAAVLAVLAFGGFLVFAFPAAAQRPGPPPGPGGAVPGTPSPAALAATQVEMLGQQLGLTAAQKAKIKPVVESTIKQAMVVMKDSKLDQVKKVARLKAIQSGVEAKIKAILTPAQQKKLAAMQKEALERAKAANQGRFPGPR